MTDCPICGRGFSKEAYASRRWANTEYLEHMRINHPDYQRWSRLWSIIFAVPVVFLIFTPIQLLSEPYLAIDGYPVIAISVVIVVVMVRIRSRALGGFRQSWRAQSSQSAPQKSVSLQVSQFASGDSGILQATGELAQELNLRDIQPTRIEWIDEIITSTGRGGTMTTIVPADYPMLEKTRIVLPKRLENALRREEWKPLITSSLLVRYWARARRGRILSTWLVFAVVIYVIIAAFTLPEELAQGSANLGIQILIAILVFIGTLFVMAALLSPKLHQEILFADKQAGERVGKEIVLDTLMKLEELGEDSSSVVRRFSRYRQPSIRERIDNLRVASLV